jgi:transcriptional regulator with XRE-family HTH domain
MDRNRRQPPSGTVHDSGKALLQRAKLIRERRLELQAELQLGLRRAHDLVMSCQRLSKSVASSSPTGRTHSGNVVSRVDVGTQDMTGDTAQALKHENALGWHPPRLDPLRDGALRDPELVGDRRLAAGSFNRFLDKVFSHNVDYITEIDTDSNAESDRDHWHDPCVIETLQKHTFWERLLEAAAANGVTTTQEAIAAELGVKQSAVAKWKAGGRPKLTRLEKIATRWRYNINWLLNEELPKRPPGVGEPDETAELLALWKALNNDNRKAALAILKQVRKGQATSSREKV